MGMAGLGLLGVYFLHLSWRKWPDPIVDAGTQWYAFWRVSQGAAPYHDFLWNYGPLSVALNGLLFNCFGPGMMVLVTANLIVYGLIVSLAYAAFRMAWGGRPRLPPRRFFSPCSLSPFSTGWEIIISPPLTPMRPPTACC